MSCALLLKKTEQDLGWYFLLIAGGFVAANVLSINWPQFFIYRGCVQFRRWFDYRSHTCIVSSWCSLTSQGYCFTLNKDTCLTILSISPIQVFEKLGPSLYDFLRANDYRPFSVDLVRDFGRQLLESVAYMHSLSLIHTDLKPENVLLVSPDYAKVVDRKVNKFENYKVFGMSSVQQVILQG
eukprot:c25203_g1_i1 orf=337-882(+)